MWFAFGVLVSIAAAWGLSAPFEALRNPILNLTTPLLGLLAGGAIAGRSLRLGRRGVAGFAIAFTLTLPILVVVAISSQAMHGNEGFLRLMMYFSAAGAFAFGLMGGIGVAISGLGPREAVHSAAVFGSAGFVGGVLLRLSLLGMLQGARSTNRILLWLGGIAFILLPATVGGTVLTRRLAARGHGAMPLSHEHRLRRLKRRKS
jgi:hypothetical protein